MMCDKRDVMDDVDESTPIMSADRNSRLVAVLDGNDKQLLELTAVHLDTLQVMRMYESFDVFYYEGAMRRIAPRLREVLSRALSIMLAGHDVVVLHRDKALRSPNE